MSLLAMSDKFPNRSLCVLVPAFPKHSYNNKTPVTHNLTTAISLSGGIDGEPVATPLLLALVGAVARAALLWPLQTLLAGRQAEFSAGADPEILQAVLTCRLTRHLQDSASLDHLA